MYWRAFRSAPLLGNSSSNHLSLPFLLQLEELKTEIIKEQQNNINLKRELEEKRTNEISALKESHRGEMAELENRLTGNHEGGIVLLEQQYQVGAMIFMTHAAYVAGGMMQDKIYTDSMYFSDNVNQFIDQSGSLETSFH